MRASERDEGWGTKPPREADRAAGGRPGDPADRSLAAEPGTAPPDQEEAPPVSELAEIESDRSLLDQLQRLQAEFSNYRKRLMRERADWDVRSKGEVFSLLVPVLDDLDRAREAHGSMPPSPEAEGLLMILSRLEDILRQAGLEQQSSEAGTVFNPHEHEALMTEPSDTYEEGMITGTLQPGYLYRGLLLRPARVRVSQGPPVAPA